MKQLLIAFFILFFILSISSCDRKRVFESYHKLDKSGWNKDSIVSFKVFLSDTVKNNNLFVNIRNEGTYPYSNLWLFLSIGSPDGKLVADTLEFSLADASGRWKGSGIGGLYDNQLIYKSSVYFPRKGEYQFSIKQGMRDNVLPGISDIGIRIEKTY